VYEANMPDPKSTTTPEGQPDPSPPKPTRGTTQTVEQQILSVRKRLGAIFQYLDLVSDVIIVCGAKLDSQNAEQDDAVEHVLRRCGSDKLHVGMIKLKKVIEDLGGITSWSDVEREETDDVLNALLNITIEVEIDDDEFEEDPEGENDDVA
jgi:hypothetical protein